MTLHRTPGGRARLESYIDQTVLPLRCVRAKVACDGSCDVGMRRRFQCSLDHLLGYNATDRPRLLQFFVRDIKPLCLCFDLVHNGRPTEHGRDSGNARQRGSDQPAGTTFGKHKLPLVLNQTIGNAPGGRVELRLSRHLCIRLVGMCGRWFHA